MRRLFPLAFVLVPSVMACTSGQKAYIPVDSPLKAWSPPEADAYAPEPPEPAPPPEKATPKPAPSKEKKAEKRP